MAEATQYHRRRRMVINHLIIHGHASGAAASAGLLAQVPGGDEAALTAITSSMIGSLCANYRVLTAGVLISYLGILSGSLLGKMGASYLYRWVPGLGNLVNAGVTFSVHQLQGWLVVALLERGILSRADFKKADVKDLKEEARRMREEGEALARSEEFADEIERLKKEVEALKRQAKSAAQEAGVPVQPVPQPDKPDR